MKQKFNPRMAKAYIALNERQCTACWKCVEVCPEQVIGKVNFFFHKHAIIQHSSNCIGCMKCVKACEFDAIKKIEKINIQ